ncbi:MAG: DUF4199 domain-containing protein [Bacteroidetes bacterium MedPE-SWsnd-G2]|nr:MAG: DUF4199 domain-containing protein [Bacteroidetes bacterium MedPE-SWsnd-G2]
MKTPVAVASKYGILIAVSLIAYFLILKLAGLHEVAWLRLFNGVIMAGGLYLSIKSYKSSPDFDYINGFKTGLLTGGIATILFSLFISIYMFHIDPSFAQLLLDEWFYDYNQGTRILVFIVFIEGLASTVVLTLSFMQIFKTSRNISQNY